ncbi:MAG TPA: Holliday junction resolvase RuvX [Pyrinomonadaceae bacterium]|nr:Holliday junction resolvase RuvX [Pyrinomonadaceae bacterium]
MIQQPFGGAQAAQVARPARVTLYSRLCRTENELPGNKDQKSAPGVSTEGRGRLLALDLGAKRVGVAVSDELRLTVRPLPALARASWKRLLRELAELCEQFDVEKVVVGLPLRLDGGEGEAAALARRVARNLGLSLKRAVVLQDERLTSKEAEAALRAEGFSETDVKARVDSAAAAIILRDYLERSVKLPDET